MTRVLRTAESVWERIDVRGPDECWRWTGSVATGGYGQHWHDGRLWTVHRDAYETRVGPIPDGLTLDHRTTCVLVCCNPAHLEPVTNAENVRRKLPVLRCPAGHDFTPENTYVRPSDGARICRRCQRERKPAQRARKKAGTPLPVGNNGSRPTRRDRYRPDDPDPRLSCPGQSTR